MHSILISMREPEFNPGMKPNPFPPNGQEFSRANCGTFHCSNSACSPVFEGRLHASFEPAMEERGQAAF
jgi:hypothetical protein